MRNILDRLTRLEQAASTGRPSAVFYIPDNGRDGQGPRSFRLGPGTVVLYLPDHPPPELVVGLNAASRQAADLTGAAQADLHQIFT